MSTKRDLESFKNPVSLTLILLAILLLPVEPAAAQRRPAKAVEDLWLDVSIGAPLVSWFNGAARPTDIARVENPSQLDLFDLVTTGRKLLIFKSVPDAEQLLPHIASQIDIMGYNLEHGPANPPDEQAAPVESARQMRVLADEYGLTLAFGPDHDFALSDGVAIAPYVDIFVLQVQRAQTDPDEVYDFVRPLIPQLREANPDLQVTVQVRTEGDVTAIASLIGSLKDDLDGVSILTSPNTVPVAEALVAELRPGTADANPAVEATAVPDETTPIVTPQTDQRDIIRNGGLLIFLVGVVVVGLLILFRSRAET
jgi:hypothetical protein